VVLSLLLLASVPVAFVMYALPLIVGFRRSHQNAAAIAVLNILTGWTFLGWVVAMVWACTATRPMGIPSAELVR